MKKISTTRNLALAISAIAFSCSLHAQTSGDTRRIEQLEKQVRDLQQKSVTPVAERVRFNGFLSVGYVSADNDSGYGDIYEDYSLEKESRLGLQGTFTITPATEVIMQLVARGNEEWDPAMEWAYIAHKFSSNFKGRVGKMRLPLFMYSDSLEVGYAQPWARPPIEVYGAIPFSSYTGIDGIYDWNLGDSTLSAQVYTGQSEVTLESNDGDFTADVRDIAGGSLTWTDFVWTLRGIYSKADAIINGMAPLNTVFYGLGFGYNNGNWQVLSEFTKMEVEGATANTENGYITLARRINTFTPYVTYSMTETTDNDERPLSAAQAFGLIGTFGPSVLSASDLFNVEREALGAGVRWDAMTNVAIKFDVTRANNFGDTGGGLPGNLAPARIYEDSTIYTIKLDAAF